MFWVERDTQSLVSQWGPPAGSFLPDPDRSVYDLAERVAKATHVMLDDRTKRTRDFSFIILCSGT